MFLRSLTISLIFLSIKTCLPQEIGKNIRRHLDVKEEVVPRIVKGWPAKLGEAPYQIALMTPVSHQRRMYYTFCGAVLVTPVTIMSAAHCFEEEERSHCFSFGQVSNKELRRTYAVAGNLMRLAEFKGDKSDGQWRRIKDMFYPKSFKFPIDDICIGHVTEEFIINDHVSPIPFTRFREEYKGKKCLVSGFGQTTKATSSEGLQVAYIQPMSTLKCSRIRRKDMSKYICTDKKLADVGKGDSGGPLVCKGTHDPKEGSHGILVGIVCANNKVGSLFTRVSSFTAFLNNGVIWNVPQKNLIWLYLIINVSDVLSLCCFIDRFANYDHHPVDENIHGGRKSSHVNLASYYVPKIQTLFYLLLFASLIG